MSSPVSKFQYTGNDVLEVMSKYAPRRNKTIEDLIRTAFKIDKLSRPKKILEFGAGKGEFIQRFIDDQKLQTHVVELDEIYLKKLYIHHMAHQTIEEVQQKMDFIYLIDVLEHLEDDQYYLQQFYQNLNAGGKLLIYVPARMELYSNFDKKIGHFRRYTLSELSTKVTTAGFVIETIKYHELLGYFAAYYNRLFSKNGELNSKAVAIYDRFLVPLTNKIEGIITPPIGKSLYAIAQKPH